MSSLFICCQGFAVKNYGVTLAAAALRRSGVCSAVIQIPAVEPKSMFRHAPVIGLARLVVR